MKFLLSVVSILFLSCHTVQKEFVVKGNIEPPYSFPHALEYSTYTLKTEYTVGIASIIEHDILTAYHVIHPGEEHMPDITIIGGSSEPGLFLCQEEHTQYDICYFKTYRGYTVGVISCTDYPNKMELTSNEAALSGDSGTPVLCLAHRKVVGLLVELEPPIFMTSLDGRQHYGSTGFIVEILTKNKIEELKK